MQVFSDVLMNLYDLASRVSPHHFPAEVLRLLRTLIPSDAAVMRIGEIETAIEQDSVSSLTLIHDIDHATSAGRAPISYHEQMMTSYLRDLPRPFTGTCHEIRRSGEGLDRYRFPRKYDSHHFLLFGVPPSPEKPARWLVLYRDKTHECFDNKEADLLYALWKHLVRAITINLNRILSETAGVKMHRASALVDSRGVVEAADEEFAALMALEWPGTKAGFLPSRVVAGLKNKSSYRGKQISISMRQNIGYMVCTISRSSLLTSLSPREQAVAERFASGSSYKKIAQQLNMSPNTVRNHIANAYRKLGINDKASLASLVMRVHYTSAYHDKSEPSPLELLTARSVSDGP
jgi:DNA-binding CsgD family transcriptional regulator